ncbi:MAG TPA: hypothetical protein VLH56_11375 [Dissulfurispiraceae bacterium]|nr:hypothetical protein [Dissulfurispiraceae bacterium]
MAQITITIDDARGPMIKRYLLSLIPDESEQPDLSTGAKIVAAFKAHIIQTMQNRITQFLLAEKRAAIDWTVEDSGVQ